MEARRRTWFDERGLVVASPSGERRVPFYCGAMHYWRVAPAKWSACLKTMHAQGFTLVETYVPWRVHQPAADVPPSWKDELDLARFVETARTAGLSVVIRPGPHINAELTSFGMPDWILADPECQARTAHGTPAWLPIPPRAFPIPSYASVKFQSAVREWYAAVAEVVRPLLAPEGPIVAISVDNEAQHFFRMGAFDTDYHPDAIAWWHEHSGLDAEPPREWAASDAARCALWMKHKDEYIARALGLFAQSMEAVGLGGVARFHNLPPGHYGLYDLRQIQTAIAGPVGIDAYTPRAMFGDLRRRALACVGNASPIPGAFEVGVGFFPWFPPLDEAAPDPTRERDHLLTLLASGIRAFNLFMTVERDRYYGAAISNTGVLESHAGWIKPLIAALAEVDWPSLRRTPAIALIDTRSDARFGIASNVVDPVTAALADILDLGPGASAELATDAGAIAARRWQSALTRALELAQVPYAIVDEAASEEELARYRAVVAATPGTRIDRGLWQRLRSLAEHKRAVVVIGPSTPTHDELDQPLNEPAPRRMGKLKAGSLEDVPGLAEDLSGVAGDLTDAWTVERPDTIRTMAYADSSGKTRVVFVVSDAERATTAVIVAAEGVGSVRDVFGERIRVDAGMLTVSMPPRGVRMLVVE